jgi:hypothetical protein
MADDFDVIVAGAKPKGAKALPGLVSRVMRDWPERIGDALAAVGGLQGAVVWEEALGSLRFRLRDVGKSLDTLDPAVATLEAGLVGVWALEHAGALRVPDLQPPPVNAFVEAFLPVVAKIAPPPPKKVKLDAPTRRVPPLARENVRAALDVAMLLQALIEIGDWTQLPDKERVKRELILDDWRRLVFTAVRIPAFAELRQIVLAPAPDSPIEKRVPTKFSRQAACQLLEAIAARRADNITALPSVSMLPCARCGEFKGRGRMRCAVCAGMFCGRCRSRTAELCLGDYASGRYGGLAADVRAKVIADAKALCAKARLDEHTRNDAFVRALAERGIDVVFQDAAPDDGEETDGQQGRRKLTIRNRENTATRKVFFASLARAHFRAAEIAHTPELEALFVDACLAVPVEEALTWKRAGGPAATESQESPAASA